MMRAHSNLYHSTISQYPNIQGQMRKPPHRESLPIEQFLPNYPKQQKQQRFSSNIDSYASSNPFAHLKNQINNLRSEFSKIIQKDVPKAQPDTNTYKQQERSMAQSLHVHNYQSRVKNRNAQTRVQSQQMGYQSKQDGTNFGNESIVRPYTYQSIKFGGDKSVNQITYKPDLSRRVGQLEKQNENLKKINEQSRKQKQALINQLQKQRLNKQQLIKEHKNDISKMMMRNQQKIRLLQQIHQKDIKQIIQNLKKSQQMFKKLSYQSIQKESQYAKMQKQLNRTNQSITQYKQQFNRLKLENIELRRPTEIIRSHNEQAAINKNKCDHGSIISENRNMLQQIQHLIFEAQQKQNLIRNLYRDISVLDNQVHNYQHIKIVLSSTFKFVEQLNQIIVELQLQRLNQKYKQQYR